MGQPTATLYDSHSCPQVDPGPIPHVGKQIMLQGSVSTLVNGKPAARVGDLCACNGPFDPIAKGSKGVYFGGKRVARLGDSTGHGGRITSGCLTVLTGETGGGGESGDEGTAETIALLEQAAKLGTVFLLGRVVKDVQDLSSVAQTAGGIADFVLDADRVFWDSTTFGVTKKGRQLLWGSGEVENKWAGLVGETAAVVVPIPGPGKLKVVKIAVDLEEFARSTQISATVARKIADNSKLVWKFSVETAKTEAERVVKSNKVIGEVIERVVAVLHYVPKGYDWVGPLKKGFFPNIDFIHYALKEQVSLKAMKRNTPESWSAGVHDMKRFIDELAGIRKTSRSVNTGKRKIIYSVEERVRKEEPVFVEKTWQPWPGMDKYKSLAAETKEGETLRKKIDDMGGFKRVLDLRVPEDMEHLVQELVAYGKARGVEVRITPF